METSWSTALWRQFGAAIDMLENALVACPASLWTQRLWRRVSAHRPAVSASRQRPHQWPEPHSCTADERRKYNAREQCAPGELCAV
jgi:hypothetical protein